jgi:hypothetical protein
MESGSFFLLSYSDPIFCFLFLNFIVYTYSKMLTIRNIAALAAVLGNIDTVIAQQGAWAQCEFVLRKKEHIS